jgi:amino-acid N-acetyltransferase
LYPFADDHTGELACLAVHPEYRNAGAGEQLLRRVESEARRQQLTRLFVLTTRATHWFIEHGFAEADVDQLPVARQAFYNYQRRSKVLVKTL